MCKGRIRERIDYYQLISMKQLGQNMYNVFQSIISIMSEDMYTRIVKVFLI